MNSPYLWRNPREVSQQLVGSYIEEISPDRFSFIDAKPVSLSTFAPAFKFSAPRSKLLKLDVLPNNIRVLLVSPHVAMLLTQICPNDFQLIPAKIRASDNAIDDYFLLNIIKKISGMDHAQSRFILLPGLQEIMKVERLRYVAGAMGEHHLARESEYEPYLWASAEIVQRFAKEKIKGCEFVPPEAIRP